MNCVYKIIFPNKNRYIGSSKDFETRKEKHKTNCNVKSKNYMRVYKEINIVGWENIQFIVLELFDYDISELDLKIKEQWWKDYLSPSLNMINAHGFDSERNKITQKTYMKENAKKVAKMRKRYNESHKNRYENKGKVITTRK